MSHGVRWKAMLFAREKKHRRLVDASELNRPSRFWGFCLLLLLFWVLFFERIGERRELYLFHFSSSFFCRLSNEQLDVIFFLHDVIFERFHLLNIFYFHACLSSCLFSQQKHTINLTLFPNSDLCNWKRTMKKKKHCQIRPRGKNKCWVQSVQLAASNLPCPSWGKVRKYHLETSAAHQRKNPSAQGRR